MKNMHEDMLNSIYFMRRTSMIWCFISSLTHSLFVVTYNIQITYFYPLLWAISSISFTCNFVRNRSKIYQKFFKIYQAFKHCTFKKICCPSSSITSPISPPLCNRDNPSASTNWDSVETPGSNLPLTTMNNKEGKTRNINININGSTSTGKRSSGTGTETQTDTLSIINHIESTIKSEMTTTITTDTHTKSRSTKNKTTIKHQPLPNHGSTNPPTDDDMGTDDEEVETEIDRIGDLDVYEDEDEMVYCGYDDPISEMRLNRKNSKFNSTKRRSNSKTQMDSYADRYNKRNSNTIQSGTKSYLPTQTNIYLDTNNIKSGHKINHGYRNRIERNKKRNSKSNDISNTDFEFTITNTMHQLSVIQQSQAPNISSLSEPTNTMHTMTNTNTDILMHKINQNNKRKHQLMPTPIDFNVNELLPNESTMNSSENMSIGATDDEDEDNTIYDTDDQETDIVEEEAIQS